MIRKVSSIFRIFWNDFGDLNSDAVGVGVVINEWFAFLVTHASSCNYEMVAENIHDSMP